MSTLAKQLGLAGALVSMLAVAGVANAEVVTMNFDQLDTVAYVAGNPFTRGQFVADYYNGGCGAVRSGDGPQNCDGPTYGAVWSANTVAFPDSGLPGRFNALAGEPSSPNVIGVDQNQLRLPQGIWMNVAGGFDTSISFWYATTSIDLNVAVYDSLDGTGSMLASQILPWKTYCVPGFQMSCWSEATIDFDGTAQSVRFWADLSNPRQFVLDNVNFNTPGSNVPVPEPAAIGMLGFGALLVGLFAALRRRFG